MNEIIPNSGNGTPDPWQSLKAFTGARIALGRTGSALPLKECLAFRMAHAHARDAVHSMLESGALAAGLQGMELPVLLLHSRAVNRDAYLKRPDWGRRADDGSLAHLRKWHPKGYDIAIVIADGLSATAVNRYALPVIFHLLPLVQGAGLTLAPVSLVQQGRVAIGDEIGSMLEAKLVLVLIGERPGLSAPDSMGAYLTFAPAPGLTDESRNCVSNIRPDGLSCPDAAEKIGYLVRESLRLRLSGVGLKDEQHCI